MEITHHPLCVIPVVTKHSLSKTQMKRKLNIIPLSQRHRFTPIFCLDEWIVCLLYHTSLGFLSFLLLPFLWRGVFSLIHACIVLAMMHPPFY